MFVPEDAHHQRAMEFFARANSRTGSSSRRTWWSSKPLHCAPLPRFRICDWHHTRASEYVTGTIIANLPRPPSMSSTAANRQLGLVMIGCHHVMATLREYFDTDFRHTQSVTRSFRLEWRQTGSGLCRRTTNSVSAAPVRFLGWGSLTLLIQKGSRPSVFTGMCTRRPIDRGL